MKSALFTALAFAVYGIGSVEGFYQVSKAVFAHYLVGQGTVAHMQQDIDNAVAMGLDGFALNIGDVTQTFVTTTLNTMTQYISSKYAGKFGVFISMDLVAAGAHSPKQDASSFVSLIKTYSTSTGWLRGPNAGAFLSTYGDGGWSNSTWQTWRNSLQTSIYFVPDFDGTQGYYDGSDGWWYYWGDFNTIFEGLFSWEASWPAIVSGYGGAYPGDVSPDVTVIKGTAAHGRSYMIGLSPLQYKDAYNTNIYRGGELNLPTRMQNILAMSTKPNFVEIITWNDEPESHYVGNIWPEQNTDVQPNTYANPTNWPHTGWQPLIHSFITAFKAGKAASAMVPPGTDTVAGALWFKTILQSTTCPNDDGQYRGGTSDPELFYEKPDGFTTGKDQLNWAVVAKTAGLTLVLRSGSYSETITLKAGLNYGASKSFNQGSQSMIVKDSTGKVVAGTAGARCVSATCVDGIYNMNVQVVKLDPTIVSGTAPACVLGTSQGTVQTSDDAPQSSSNSGGHFGAHIAGNNTGVRRDDSDLTRYGTRKQWKRWTA